MSAGRARFLTQSVPSNEAPHTAAVNVGVDNTGAAVLRPIEGRDFSADGDVAATLFGLLTNSRLAAWTVSTATSSVPAPARLSIPLSLTAFLTNPTATAAGGGTRVVLDITVAASLGTTTQINFKDEIFMGTTSSFLLYTFAAVTGPSWAFVFDLEEVT